jgi:hypothetical protein
MKQYRVVTNGRVFKVQEKTVLNWRQWVDTNEELIDPKGGGETFHSLVQFDTESKAIAWIERNSPEEWKVVYERGNKILPPNPNMGQW